MKSSYPGSIPVPSVVKWCSRCRGFNLNFAPFAIFCKTVAGMFSHVELRQPLGGLVDIIAGGGCCLNGDGESW